MKDDGYPAGRGRALRRALARGYHHGDPVRQTMAVSLLSTGLLGAALIALNAGSVGAGEPPTMVLHMAGGDHHTAQELPEGTPRLLLVPDLTGYPAARAVAVLEGQLHQVVQIRMRALPPGVPNGTVLAQSPAGAMLPEGSLVVLTIGGTPVGLADPAAAGVSAGARRSSGATLAGSADVSPPGAAGSASAVPSSSSPRPTPHRVPSPSTPPPASSSPAPSGGASPPAASPTTTPSPTVPPPAASSPAGSSSPDEG